MNEVLYIAWRVLVAVLFSFVVVMLIIGVGMAFGKVLGLEENRSLGEVISAFVSGGIITMIYKDRIDDRNERKNRGS
jgi:hypothetical protein